MISPSAAAVSAAPVFAESIVIHDIIINKRVAILVVTGLKSELHPDLLGSHPE